MTVCPKDAALSQHQFVYPHSQVFQVTRFNTEYRLLLPASGGQNKTTPHTPGNKDVPGGIKRLYLRCTSAKSDKGE